MSHETFMQRCFRLALNGLGNTAPNPLVGAVIVHEGQIIGEGYHAQYGGPHAEVMAIRNCKRPELLPQCTLYVNLEPCSHFGKTPPCADLILDKKIPRVVVCNLDPFPEVSGRGIKKLRDAGVDVTTGVLEKEGAQLNRRFFTFHTEKRPYIILKWAQTADGFMDGTAEQPLKITTPLTDQRVHQWRTQEAGILVGYATALKDNPKLTARLFPGKNPVRMVWDPQPALPPTLHLFSDGEPTLVFNAEKNADNGAVKWIKAADIHAIAKSIYEHNIQSVIIEGGAKTLDAFMRHNLWDEARVITGKITAGKGVEAPKPIDSALTETIDSDGDTIRIYEPRKARQHT